MHEHKLNRNSQARGSHPEPHTSEAGGVKQHPEKSTIAPARGAHPNSIVDLQRTIGNEAVVRMLSNPIQRFGEKEHRNIGDWATNRGYARLGTKGYLLTYGELVSMAGDMFPSLKYMENLANNPGKGAGTSEELDYARFIKIGRRRSQDARTDKQQVEDDMNGGLPIEEAKYNPANYTKEAKKAVDDLYYKLAVDNSTHFDAPRGKDGDKEWQDRPAASGSSYRTYHEQALKLAWEAGKNGGSTASAVAAEAFGDHFLTDAVSAGHMRTPRLDIIDHWKQRDTGFIDKFKGYMMLHVSEWILANTKLGKGLGPGVIYSVVGDGIDQALKSKPPLTLGILVAVAIHDFDNKNGLKVLSQGKKKTIYGDGHLLEGDTEKIAIAAVRAGLTEVHQAHQMGASVKTFKEVREKLLEGGTQYRPELIIPKLDPDEGDQNMPVWKVNTFEELLADSNMEAALKLTILNNMSEINDIASGMKEPAKSGIKHGFADMVKADPIKALRGIYNYKETKVLDIRNMGVELPTH